MARVGTSDRKSIADSKTAKVIRKKIASAADGQFFTRESRVAS
jgi:hypothetical protein